LDNKKLKHFRQLLLNEKDELVTTLELMEEMEPNDSMQEYFDELSSYDNHPADVGSETFQMEMNFNLKNNELMYIKEVDKALERINNGKYGKCISCGKDIAEDRLEILPTAIECMDCENKGLTLDELTKTRPVEEEVLGTPFKRTFRDNTEYNGFDGEDSWQAVARYNKTDYDQRALDWYDNNMYDESISGVVENTDNYSEDLFKNEIENTISREDTRNHNSKNNHH